MKKVLLMVLLAIPFLTNAQIHLHRTKSITPYFMTSLVEQDLDTKGVGIIYSMNRSASEWNVDLSALRKISSVGRINNIFENEYEVKSFVYSGKIGYYHRIIELNKPLLFKYMMSYLGVNAVGAYESMALENNDKSYITLENQELISYGANISVRFELYFSSRLSVMCEFGRELMFNTPGGHVRGLNKLGVRYYLFN